MKIGILTFSNAYNLGGALQAFSLQKVLEEAGNDAELIDYRCAAIEAMHKLRPVFAAGMSLKARVYNLIYNLVFFPRRVRYKRFQKKSKRSRMYTAQNISEADGNYDLFVTGSDQVFNLKLTGNDSAYFLDFAKKGTKASYAASLGVFLSEEKERYRSYLSSFRYLSVREQSSAELFMQELDIEAQVMPDPVFLHTGEEWKRLLGIKEHVKEKYILVYALMENQELYEIAAKVAQKKGLKIYVITKALKPVGKADCYIRNAGPREFIDLMVNASYIVTNSFHGTAFSLIFQKEFAVSMPSVAQERITDLLKTVKLDHHIYSGQDESFDNDIDYSEVANNITHLQVSGKKYLKRMTE